MEHVENTTGINQLNHRIYDVYFSMINLGATLDLTQTYN